MGFYTNVTLEKHFTWVKYTEGMCESCVASCCKLQTEVDLEDLISMGVLTDFHRDEPLRSIAKQLKKEGVVVLFNLKRELFTLAQKKNKDCLFLDSETRRCTVYEGRPKGCRDHPQVNSPNPGHCAYIDKSAPLKG